MTIEEFKTGNREWGLDSRGRLSYMLGVRREAEFLSTHYRIPTTLTLEAYLLLSTFSSPSVILLALYSSLIHSRLSVQISILF